MKYLMLSFLLIACADKKNVVVMTPQTTITECKYYNSFGFQHQVCRYIYPSGQQVCVLDPGLGTQSNINCSYFNQM